MNIIPISIQADIVLAVHTLVGLFLVFGGIQTVWGLLFLQGRCGFRKGFRIIHWLYGCTLILTIGSRTACGECPLTVAELNLRAQMTHNDHSELSRHCSEIFWGHIDHTFAEFLIVGSAIALGIFLISKTSDRIR